MKILINFKNMDKKKIKEIIVQFIKFGMVGASNTVISLIIYYVLVYFHCNYIIANTIGFIISVLNAYYWNNRYVFEQQGNKHMLKKLLKVYISYGITFVLSTGLLYLMVNCMNISQYLAPVINLIVTVPLNFVLNKLWAFKR